MLTGLGCAALGMWRTVLNSTFEFMNCMHTCIPVRADVHHQG